MKTNNKKTVAIDKALYDKLRFLGIIDADTTRSLNEGSSNYSTHIIQPWSIWQDYPELTSFDHDIVKRVLRTKVIENVDPIDSRIEDYNKIIHICHERIRQLRLLM